MYTTSDFRNGLKIEFEGDPYVIVYFQHVKPGKGGAFVRTKLKNLKTGAVLEHTFRSGDKVDKPDLEDRDMHFMDRMAEAEPGVRAKSGRGGSNPAKLESGAVVQVPLFLNVEDKIKVDTRTGTYIER